MTPAEIKERFPGLQQASSQDLEHLLQTAALTDIAAGADVISPGTESNSLYLICSGSMRVSLEAEDECTILGDYGPGQWIGELGMIEPAIAVARVTTINDCAVLRLSHDNFMTLRRQCPELTSILLQLFSSDMAQRLRTTIQFIDGEIPDAELQAEKHWYTEVAKRMLGIAARIGA